MCLKSKEVLSVEAIFKPPQFEDAKLRNECILVKTPGQDSPALEQQHP